MNPEDYLTTFYGSVPQSLRELYFGYLGWFNADPTFLLPTPTAEAAKRMVTLMRGPAAVLSAAGVANDTDPQWAAELLTLLLQDPTLDADIAKSARQLKARALTALGSQAINPNWRNWYISAALQLDTGLPDRAIVGRRASCWRSAAPSPNSSTWATCRSRR